MKPYISIIMPTMRIGGLDIVFDCLEKQTFKDFELILVDNLYDYRKDIVKEKLKQYSFQCKHINTIKKQFPLHTYCHCVNSGIVQASGDIILFSSDYYYRMPNFLQKHADFHKITPDNWGYAPPGLNIISPTLLKKDLPTYGINNHEQYMQDLEMGKLQNFMWSIFDDSSIFNSQNVLHWPEEDRNIRGYDMKIDYNYGQWVSPDYIFLQCESVKIKPLLAANGLNEELDGCHAFQDVDLSYRLKNLFDFKWVGDNTNISYRMANAHQIINKVKLISSYKESGNLGKSIFEKYKKGSTDQVNDWNLSEIHAANQKKQEIDEQIIISKKIAIVLGPYSVGARPLDFWFNNIWDNPRGLTGSDLTFIQTALEFKKLGYDVSAFTVHAQPDHKQKEWEGIKLFNVNEIQQIDDSYDAIISINEPDIFRFTSKKPVKILWQMLNDFPYCGNGYEKEENWENLYDIALGVCSQHTEYLQKQVKQPEKWGTVPLGCTPEWYQDKRVPGRMIWCSSADRGLHWLLSEWPEIKKAVPYASLKIFYHFNFNQIDKVEPNSTDYPPKFVEMGNRIRYIQQAINKLKLLGVEYVGSISREQMKKEFNEASVFPFCCDTVVFSEGFSISALEAHASYTVPIISEQDCLGMIYKHSGCVMLKTPIANNLSQFRESIIKSLTDQDFANTTIKKCLEFAEQFTWTQSIKKMEQIINFQLIKSH